MRRHRAGAGWKVAVLPACPGIFQAALEAGASLGDVYSSLVEGPFVCGCGGVLGVCSE